MYENHIERGGTKLGLPTLVNVANTLRVTVDDLLCTVCNTPDSPMSGSWRSWSLGAVTGG
ncbi:MAG: hypothetical protein K5990_02470 [Oscillospiraceae bacterium]|nr:hypothetical protein [Oscillospiraceae bacterium]